MDGDFVDPVDWGLANAAQAGIGHAMNMRADRKFKKSGRARCGLRVIDGNQPGLSGRWRVGEASFSSRRLTFRRRGWRMLGECPPIQVVAIHGPARAPTGDEVLKLPGGVVQILTPTATLEWALRDRYRPAAVERLKVAQRVPAEEAAPAPGPSLGTGLGADPEAIERGSGGARGAHGALDHVPAPGGPGS